MSLSKRLTQFLAGLTLFVFASGALAALPPGLSAEERAAAAQAEAYLNGITTLKARFIQVAPNGNYAEGTAYLWRPGRMRLDYDPPSPIQVFADGRFLIYYDRELEQTSYLGLGSTPAGILLRRRISFGGGELKVTGVERQAGVVTIDLVQANDPGAGAISLVFSEQPFALRQWKVTDAQGAVTTVSLYETRTGVALDPKLFNFVDPQFR